MTDFRVYLSDVSYCSRGNQIFIPLAQYLDKDGLWRKILFCIYECMEVRQGLNQMYVQSYARQA